MRGLRSTLVLLVTFLVIGGYAWFVERERPPASEADAPEQAFGGLETDHVTALTVTAGNGDVTEVSRASEGANDWTMTSPVGAPADNNAATGIASTLANLEIRRVVQENVTDLSPFGLAPPAFSVTFTAAGGEPRTVMVGDETPTGGERYATIGDGRLLLIQDALETMLNRETFDLRDRSVLEFTGPDTTSLTVEHAAPPADGQVEGTLRFEKAEGDWRIAAPLDVRADFGPVEALVGRVGSAEMLSIVEEAAEGEALAEYGLETPRATVAIGVARETHTLLIGDETPEMTVLGA